MKILSLFDGMACWYEALQKVWIPIDKYYASEIDKYAIQVATKNHPDIIEIWDVCEIKWENYQDIDLLIWGSPCQWFSIAGKQLAFNDPRSKLFFEYVRILKESKPKYFLLENVKMKKEYVDIISEILWVQPIEINSALLSAQNRKRLYWTNIPWVYLPQDKWILLKDIIQTNTDTKYNLSEKWMVMLLRNLKAKDKDLKYIPSLIEKITYPSRVNQIESLDIKCPTLTASMWTGWGNTPYIVDSNKVRKLTPIECERLQTLPDNYTAGVSDTQRYKMLGNWWTVDVIAHIFRFILSSDK